MPIKVLIIDDSLFIRTLLPDLLNTDPEIKVIGTAKSGQEALKKIPKIKPDCITLDLAMPGWDGLVTLEHIMDEYPVPVVILSAYTREEADITMECLEKGAVSFVLKPGGEISIDIETVKDRLIKEIKTAANVNVKKLKSLIKKKQVQPLRKAPERNKIIVIGASTGGPQVLSALLSSIPGNYNIPILVAQHMPNRFFTESLAEHLNKKCQLRAQTAEDRDIILPQKIYLAPGGFHLVLHDTPHDDIRISLNEAPPNSLSPSIDMMMESVSNVYNGNTIGIILSGIGNQAVS